MEKTFDIALNYRKRLTDILETLPEATLAAIPKGFNNNIFWNLAHVVVAQQMLTYKRCGLPVSLEPEFIAKYAKGSKPDGSLDPKEVAFVKTALVALVEQTQRDYKAGMFKNYQEYGTSDGNVLTSFEDAQTFCLYHEGMHIGAIKSLMAVLA